MRGCLMIKAPGKTVERESHLELARLRRPQAWADIDVQKKLGNVLKIILEAYKEDALYIGSVI